MTAAENIRVQIFELKPHRLDISASFGVAGKDGEQKEYTFAELFESADEAGYYSKDHGRNQVNSANALQ